MSHSARSFWVHDYGAYTPNPPLQDDIAVDVAVVGGGFSGMSSAWNIKQHDSSADVALIESEVVGFGASGRAAGWVMTQFGLDQMMIKSIYGLEKARAAFRYCSAGVDYVRKMLAEHDMQSDYHHPGLMRVAFGEKWLPVLEATKRYYEDMGVADVQWMDKKAVEDEINSPLIMAAVFEHNMGHLNPCKHVREWKRIVMDGDIDVYEQTPAIDIDRKGRKVKIKTPGGSISADKVVLATNAYTHLLSGEVGDKLRRDQSPIFPQLIITEPLTGAQWDDLGWKRRCSIEGTLNLFHNTNPYKDRVIFSFPHHLGYSRGGEMNRDFNARNIQVTVDHFHKIFPTLKGVKVAQAWGGPVSATMDLVPHIGFFGDERIIYTTGCWGHGIALTQQNGRTIADLVMDRQTDRTDFWIVNRKPKKWLPNPLGYASRKSVIEFFKWMDRRQLKGTSLQNL